MHNTFQLLHFFKSCPYKIFQNNKIRDLASGICLNTSLFSSLLLLNLFFLFRVFSPSFQIDLFHICLSLLQWTPPTINLFLKVVSSILFFFWRKEVLEIKSLWTFAIAIHLTFNSTLHFDIFFMLTFLGGWHNNRTWRAYFIYWQ